MTARDEAIDAISPVLPTTCDCGFPHNIKLAGRVLDAIPPDVLARLAIEQGGLEQAGWQVQTYRGLRFLAYHAGEAGHADHERIYRVVEP